MILGLKLFVSTSLTMQYLRIFFYSKLALPSFLPFCLSAWLSSSIFALFLSFFSFINTCSVTISISDPPFATPDGQVQPSLVFEDIVKRKFGSESVYCANMWQSVLQTCRELNQIQTSKIVTLCNNRL